jgi:hypothetical protein
MIYFLALESEFQNKFQKHEKRYSEVAVQKDNVTFDMIGVLILVLVFAALIHLSLIL